MATETDAARDRVIAARAALDSELGTLEASARAAVDIPARVRRSPGKAAAVAGGAGFLVLKGPQRLFGAARRIVRGPKTPMPPSMLPDEVEKTLRALGSDGDKVRGALERDFADYAKQSSKERQSVRRGLLMAVAMPLLTRGAKRAGDWLMSPDAQGFGERLAEVRGRAEEAAAKAGSEAERAGRRASEEVDRARTARGKKARDDDEAASAGA